MKWLNYLFVFDELLPGGDGEDGDGDDMDDGGPMLQGADDRERKDPKDEKDDHCAHQVILREVLPKLQHCKFHYHYFSFL